MHLETATCQCAEAVCPGRVGWWQGPGHCGEVGGGGQEVGGGGGEAAGGEVWHGSCGRHGGDGLWLVGLGSVCPGDLLRIKICYL